MDPVCSTVSPTGFYNGSCTWMHCYNQYVSQMETCDASGLTASFFLVSLLAFAVSFFSRKF